jgi:adenylate cyclase
LRKTFADGLTAYRQQDWDVAQAHFEACLRIAPDDGPTRVFLDRIGILRSSPPGTGWDGVWHFDKK